MKQRLGQLVGLLSFFFTFCCVPSRAATWLPFGPDGGDARAFAVDSHDTKHIYLGAANGWIFESVDGGGGWKRLARVGKRDDLVLDSIVVDASNSKHIVVGTWVLGRVDGGLYVSTDGGTSWASNPSMAGQSIRALSAAPSDAKILVAGTLKGVYRSSDGGTKWDLISPEASQEIHEVESIAIDPSDPKIIYAGTWHLPWKTVDGGEHWNNIKEGIIEDSDVFSIIVDPKQPKVVYASACSGIYKSENSGDKFKKIQGIPSTARRTRVLMQDPSHVETVYAGTTEGLFRTDDSGQTWVRTTGPEIIVNDVYVDPADPKHVVLATDRGGVLTSHDRGNSFEASNKGYSARQITSYVADARQPMNVFVGVVNDKEWGGVFESENGGLSWIQQSAGLGGRDVFSLGQASDGIILAGTRHGIYLLKGAMWSRAADAVEAEGTATAPQHGKKTRAPVRSSGQAGKGRTQAAGKGSPDSGLRRSGPGAKVSRPEVKTASAQESTRGTFDGSVYAISQGGDTLYAATSEGLLSSGTAGETWSRVQGVPQHEMLFVSVSKSVIVAAGLKGAMYSKDSGKTWEPMKLPESLTQVSAVAVDASGSVWMGGREGVLVSGDGGASWQTLNNLYIRDVNGIYYDEASDRVVITAGGTSTLVFAVHLPDKAVRFWETGWNLRFARPVGNHLIAATMFDGMVIQPEMINSAESAAH